MNEITQLFGWCYHAWIFVWTLIFGFLILGLLVQLLICLYQSCAKGDWRPMGAILIFAIGCSIGWENRDSVSPESIRRSQLESAIDWDNAHPEYFKPSSPITTQSNDDNTDPSGHLGSEEEANH